MNDDLQQLKTVLQVLALPVTGQVHLVGDDFASIEVLVKAFDTTHHTVRTQAGAALMPEQAKTLTRLGDQLGRLRRESSSDLSSELAMRQSKDWRRVRVTAREALVRCRWKLEVPSAEVLGQLLSQRALSNSQMRTLEEKVTA